MFRKQYRFTGTHANMVNEVTAIFDEFSKTRLFEHNYDVYINAPIIGFLYGKKGIKNTNSEIADQNIFPEQMINNSDQLTYLLRLILILDSDYEPDEEKRLDKAFRELGKDENDLALFDSYVLGGVEILYEKLITEASGLGDYMNRLYDFIEEFHERFNDDISNKDILELCRKNSNSN